MKEVYKKIIDELANLTNESNLRWRELSTPGEFFAVLRGESISIKVQTKSHKLVKNIYIITTRNELGDKIKQWSSEDCPELTNSIAQLYEKILRIARSIDEIIKQVAISKKTSLKLSGNGISLFPVEILQLKDLATLDLSNNNLTSVPFEIGQLTNLQELDIDNNRLTALPPEIGKLTNLVKLDLNHNQLTAFPPEISILTNLEGLNLRNNKLTELPLEIGKLTRLRELHLEGNPLESPPLEIVEQGTEAVLAYLRALARIENAARESSESLDLSYLKLTALPPEIGKLTNLQTLYLYNNQLTALPPEIGRLTNLQGLYLENNRLTKLPLEIGKLTNLQTLSLRHNQLTALLPEIGKLTNLQELYLYDNQLTALPPEMGELTNLETLELGGNPLESPPLEIVEQGTEAVLGYLREKVKEMNEEQQKAYDEALAKIEEAGRENSESLDLSDMDLTTLPPEIGKLTNLRLLKLYSNRLTALPPEIGKLTNLEEELNFTNNQLTELPAEIGNLANLKNLRLGRNQLTACSPEICKLTNLQNLDLGENQLTELPVEIGKLTNLKRLYLDGNNLTSLPTEIGQLKELEGFYLHGNDELGIPPEVLGHTWAESGEKSRTGDIFDYYFRQRKEEKRELREAKVLLVGQGGVGKTSLVKRLIDNYYDSEEPKTEGINIRDWGVDGKVGKDGKDSKIKLNVWDFGGQEIMHATHQFFLTKRSLYVLVLDARKGENECNIQYWLKIIQSYGGDSPVLVVTNQCDHNYLELNENRLTKDYAPNIKGFFTTSCKSGKGIEGLKAAIEKEINEMPHVYDVLPKSYFDIKQKLEKLAESKNFIDIGVYRELCRENTVGEEKEQDLLLRFLHDLGNVLNFGDPEDPYKLRDTNILNPEWVTEGVYKILNNEELQKQKDKGVLRMANIASILTDKKKYPKERHEFIINMMQKFELCFDFPEKKGRRVLIPELLPKNEPNIEWDQDDSLNFEYHYEVLPSGLMCRFIVRMHSKVTKHHVYWRSGVQLQIGENMALVRGDTDEGRVYISVTGTEKSRREALGVIREEFKAIHATMPRLDVKEKVPLADEEGVAVDYETLLKREKAGETMFWPDEASRNYSITELLDGVDVRESFDVFLCHNSEDKAAVKRIGEKLKDRGLRVWLDEWELQPGLPWQRALEKQIESVKSAAVFVGDSGIGPWEEMEMEAFLREFVSRGCSVIPVIFKDCEKKPKLPVFLRGMGWVDFRKDEPDPIEQLVWGITGKNPGDDISEQ